MQAYRKPVTFLISGMLLYALVISPFSAYMRQKPIEEKLGYIPSLKVIRPLSADHKELVAASLLLKVLMYFGGLSGETSGRVTVKQAGPDYQGMSRIIHGALALNPYNLDGYYFAQSFLTWDVKQYKLANDLLDHGMKYRTWDWYLPFFAGFNSAYFMKDYPQAAKYYKRAGELSGAEMHISLAGRYMQESGQTDLAISYLSMMLKGARDDNSKKHFGTRLKAFEEVRRIEQARDRFMTEKKRSPVSIDELMTQGFLISRPVDPYGGTFLLDPSGKVTTTSKFAFATKGK